MFDTLCDFAKVLVCKQCPKDISEMIFNIAHHAIQEPVKAQMNIVCLELKKDKRAVYFNLLSQVYDKYIDNYDSLQQLQPEDFVVRYYLHQMIFDIRICSQSRDLKCAFDMFERFLLRNRAKEGYVMAMQYILSVHS
jgi:hypothetical protein